MKRFLALLLTLVMLVSVCGLQAFAADGDTSADTGDELVVYTRSGATRTFHVGDTFSYTYWFRLTSGSVNKITGHVLYDSQCLSVNADSCKFPNMTSPSTKNNAGDFEFHDTFTTSQGGEFATTSPQTMANISFTVTRGGTAYRACARRPKRQEAHQRRCRALPGGGRGHVEGQQDAGAALPSRGGA